MSEPGQDEADAFLVDQLDALAAENRAMGSRIALLRRMYTAVPPGARPPPQQAGPTWLGKDDESDG